MWVELTFLLQNEEKYIFMNEGETFIKVIRTDVYFLTTEDNRHFTFKILKLYIVTIQIFF